MCKDCQCRVVGCHATCERYNEWKREQIEKSEAILQAKKKEYCYIRHHKDIIGKEIKKSLKK